MISVFTAYLTPKSPGFRWCNARYFGIGK